MALKQFSNIEVYYEASLERSFLIRTLFFFLGENVPMKLKRIQYYLLLVRMQKHSRIVDAT